MKAATVSVALLALSSTVGAEDMIRVPLNKRNGLQSIMSKLEVSASHKAKLTSEPGNEDVIDYRNTQYYGEVSLGTPEQKFEVLFDTSVSDLLVPSNQCDSSCSYHTQYSSTSSSTYIRKGQKYDYTDAMTGKTVSGFQSMDTLNFGGYEVPFQGFVEVTSISGSQGDYQKAKFDGVLGMGMGSQSVNDQNTAMENLKNEGMISKNMFGLYLGNSTSEVGELSLGGYDSAHASYTPHTVYTINSEHWLTSLSSWSMYKAASSSSHNVLFDTSSAFITGPVAEVAEIAESIGAWEVDGVSGLYTIGCDYSLPNFKATLGSYTYEVPAGNYLFRIEDTNTCLFGIRGMDLTSPVSHDQPMWSFGDVFLRSYYTYFDLTSTSSPKIGIATAV